MENSAHEKFNILYVGGDTSIIKDFQEKKELFKLNHVENGLAAISFLNNNDIDAILSEDTLPGLNGLGLLNMIRNKHIDHTTPFIIISHEKDPDLSKEMIREKVDDLYFSPVNVQDIHTRIKFLKFFKNSFGAKEESPEKVREYKIPFIKRAFDILVSFFALLLLSPLLIVVAIAIKIESRGSVYYKSKRVGTGYKIFDFYKFRSMYTGADAKLKELEHLNKYAKEKQEEIIEEETHSDCPRCEKLPEGEYCSPTLYSGGEKICEYWYNEQKRKKGASTFLKIKDDPRITKVGKFIRNTSIDELPQLINVLKGDMSIVGNRPLPLYEAELLTSDDWSQRFLGPAGITGLWQVELRGKKGEMSEEERKALDNEYAKNYSFWGDIKLILRTIPALFQKENV
ncbi:MAG: sugar transferase [Bacteroidales bacterium]|nr:sugar transferase [Bacteroidales bacterium]MCF8399001.1 sugar transferase [Bacteroidales bacterium]